MPVAAGASADAGAVMSTSTPNLTTAHNQSSSSLSPVKAKTATMTSQSRPTTPTPGENERDEELGSRSLYSFYVVLKAIHEVVTSAPSEPMTTSASTSFAENNNNDSSNGGGGNKVSSNVDNNRSSSSTHSSMNETSSGNGTTTTENKESSALKYMVVIPGSGGVAGDTLRYVRRFASMGHVVIAPDDMAWPMHLRYRPRKDLPEDSAAEEENEKSVWDLLISLGWAGSGLLAISGATAYEAARMAKRRPAEFS